jgi:aminodeoxyfutalosine synthase
MSSAREKGMHRDLPNSMGNRKLAAVAEKVVSRIPVSEEDAITMLTTHDVLDLGSIAHYVRTKRHGSRAFYGVNMNLNYTNICELRCPLCAFSRDEGDEDAYLLSLDEIETQVRDAVALGIDEVHIVGGLHPGLRIDYFEQMLRRIKRVKPDLFIVAFTAVEFDYLARMNDLKVEEVFNRLLDAGLGALPGGGAEIFDEGIREVIAPRKMSGKRWLEVMGTAHSMGLKTNATLLHNHLERPEDIVDHLSRIRALQDETGGFKTFVPLTYHDANTGVKAKRSGTTGFGDIRLYATSRIFLQNVPHIKALWMYVGEKMAQVLLHFGVDDIGATYHYEKVVHAAGASTPNLGNEAHLRRLIETAGLEPVRATADYQPVEGNRTP